LVFSTSSFLVASTAGQPAQSSQVPVLKQLSIEELVELDVTLPLRREDRVMDAPAAITLLTGEDLRRQGAVSLPEALRHTPGLYVARFSGSSWVVASRGFASTSTNKILVMIDGRSVYSPLFSGVFWEQQDALLLDLDRVEVIRGPGASLWGANAVNGVINVVSKGTADTQGTLVTVGGGAEEQLMTGVRHGGRAGNGHYRVHGKFFQRDGASLANDVDAGDGQRFGQAGFRTDWDRSTDAFTVQGDVFRTTNDPLPGGRQIRSNGANVLARWTRRPSSRSEWQVQSYLDRTHRIVPNQIDEARTTWDVDVQHRRNAHARHTLSTGVSYRFSTDQTIASPLLAFDPANRATHLFSGFVQDEIVVSPTLTAIAGTKVERNDYTGVEWQPSVRMRWMPTRAHTVWAAASRAVRMPTRFDTDVRVFQGPVLVAVGNPDFESESVIAYEVGYRAAPSPYVAFDLTAFHNRYDNLRTQELTGARVRVGNGLNNRSRGANLSMTVQPRPWARLTGAYTRPGARSDARRRQHRRVRWAVRDHRSGAHGAGHGTIRPPGWRRGGCDDHVRRALAADSSGHSRHTGLQRGRVPPRLATGAERGGGAHRPAISSTPSTSSSSRRPRAGSRFCNGRCSPASPSRSDAVNALAVPRPPVGPGPCRGRRAACARVRREGRLHPELRPLHRMAAARTPAAAAHLCPAAEPVRRSVDGGRRR
jgi:iron complex outermembrane recepter protein